MAKLPRAKIIKGKKPAANDHDVPVDEITLAELIQNAAARGLHSVRGGLYGKPAKDDDEMSFEYNGVDYCSASGRYSEDDAADMSVKRLKAPPKGTTCACALGAQLLSPRVSNPLTALAHYGNDKTDDEVITEFEYADLEYADQRSVDIGAAYEQALRPER